MAVLGWAVSIYFGFFRYRQYVWSRNKVRYDLFYKIDQRRANLAAKLRLFADLKKEGKPRIIRARSLFRRYLELLGQIDFHQDQETFDLTILNHLEKSIAKDLQDFLSHYPKLIDQVKEWHNGPPRPGTFSDNLTKELFTE